MSKYTIKDFKIGDKVYHLSNSKLMMVAVKLNDSLGEVSCRWVDKDGKVQNIEFLAEELGKADDLKPRISIMTV